jgi:hypothetical protein
MIGKKLGKDSGVSAVAAAGAAANDDRDRFALIEIVGSYRRRPSGDDNGEKRREKRRA